MTTAALWLCVRLLVRDHRTPLVSPRVDVRVDGLHLVRGLR